jgi:hypothetical protein
MSSGAIVTQEGAGQLETDLLAGGTLEGWYLRLFASNHTPLVTDTLATYTALEASFTGYSSTGTLLTRSIAGTTWGVVSATGGTSINAAGNAKSTYHSGTPQSWSATSAQVIYGHFYAGVTSGKSILAQLWGSPVSLTNPSTLTLTPVFEFGAIGG